MMIYIYVLVCFIVILDRQTVGYYYPNICMININYGIVHKEK